MTPPANPEPTGSPVRWAELTSPEAADLVTRVNAVIIPVGAVEQHGPHLPLAVDTIIARAVAEAVSAETGIPVTPALSFGVSASHGNFAGTLAVQPETMIALVTDLFESLYASGVRQFVTVSGHIWNSGSLDVAIEKMRVRHDDARVRAIGYVTM